MTGQPRSASVGTFLAIGLTVLAGGTALAGCTASRPAQVRPDPAVPALKLVAFDDCADLLTGLRTAARQSVGPYGLPSDPNAGFAADSSVAVPDGARALGEKGPLKAVPGAGPGAAGNPAGNPAGGTGANPAGDAARAPDHSGTNANEAGADEPDLVKTDGRRIVTVSRGTLRVVDAASRRVTGSLALDQNAAEVNLLLAGDHALVLTNTAQFAPLVPGGPGVRPGGPGVMEPMPAPTVGARLLLVDLSGTPRLLGRYTIDGSLVDARQVGSTTRVVVRSSPRLPFQLGGDRPDDQRIADNRQVIDSTPVQQWLPQYTVDSGGRQSTGRVDCHAVSRPDIYSGASLLTILSFDLASSTLGSGDPTSLVADGDTVYANATSLYVASDDRWRLASTFRGGRAPARMDERSTIYKFDIAGSGRPRYVAGGAVPGWLINQYAMSEWDGKLRVATTLGPPWDLAAKAESSVYVLDGGLREIGHVGGLGKGERIYAVRFVGPTGYVVTFRQTDPLYVVDLRNPAAPKVTGELKINGYSAYLHPAGDGRVIGLGQDADANGRVNGLQISLFDVADPAHPSRIARYAVPGGYTEAEFDPHAFLYWPKTGLLVVPMSTPTIMDGSGNRAAALALRLSGAAINSVGNVAGPPGEQIRRALVVGDVLWTVSDTTLTAYDLASLARLAQL